MGRWGGALEALAIVWNVYFPVVQKCFVPVLGDERAYLLRGRGWGDVQGTKGGRGLTQKLRAPLVGRTGSENGFAETAARVVDANVALTFFFLQVLLVIPLLSRLQRWG